MKISSIILSELSSIVNFIGVQIPADGDELRLIAVRWNRWLRSNRKRSKNVSTVFCSATALLQDTGRDIASSTKYRKSYVVVLTVEERAVADRAFGGIARYFGNQL